MSTVKVLYRSHVLTTFLGPVLGAMMKQLLASRRSKACACLRHEDKARLTGTIVGVPSMIDGVAVGHCGAFWTCKSTAVCERCASFGKQGHCRILFSRPSLERGMEAASGKKRTPQHEGVTEGRGGNGRKPPPPIQCATHPIGHPQGGLLLLLCISQTPEMHPRPFFGGFSHPQWSFARVLPHPQGHPQARGGRYVDQKWLVFRTLSCNVAA